MTCKKIDRLADKIIIFKQPLKEKSEQNIGDHQVCAFTQSSGVRFAIHDHNYNVKRRENQRDISTLLKRVQRYLELIHIVKWMVIISKFARRLGNFSNKHLKKKNSHIVTSGFLIYLTILSFWFLL